ncbi:MAG: Lrp/AsnC family transcriptional regulator [Candidatus Verstraetearchaeota archaeon]|jgi:DNA-binding Lrp family transcriptional regulator|nr:Lrp/AsnC family transcriptional regulator [Candidatus Verstraetearchaeota archaeon]
MRPESTENTEKLDDIDLKIIDILQKDSRLSYHKIASELGISVGTAYNRIKSLEERGIIKGYTVLIDMAKVGYDLTAIILIQAEGKHLIEVENEIAKMNNVISVYDITGDFDIAVIAKFKNRDSLNRFIKSLISLTYVRRTVTNVVLNVVKEDFVLKIL